MEQQPMQETHNIWERNRMLIKGFMVGFLILIMLIPMALLDNLVNERRMRQQQVTEEISSKWASSQTIVGPVVVLPYILRNDSGKVLAKRNLYLLPEQLNIKSKVVPEVRHRSLYDVTLYRSDITFTGIIDPAAVQKLSIPQTDILWSEAHMVVGLDDARGLEDDVRLNWNNAAYVLEAGMSDNNVVKDGLSAGIVVDSQQKTNFNISLKIKGSQFLYFTPTGKTTTASVTSSWKNPAFDGQYLPSQPASITQDGFSANWKVLQVSRAYPQAWVDANTFDIKRSAFGVKLLQPTDSYAKTERTVKYALLIIALTFTIFFFVEIFQKKQIHPLQYILVGIALCVFYTLLLSISEYIGFNGAYAIASIATVALIGLYVLGIFKKLQIAAGFATALGALYTYIFVLIQLQDYALLFGSVGLFVILAIIMYFSRKIDWYGIVKHQ
ncbi:MAG: cell envelope integrity protein CreD [Sphingobacteriales bacterium]|nr:MAG: cell envelope integrity protein CreD [Sphingobacteriales bacterium]